MCAFPPNVCRLVVSHSSSKAIYNVNNTGSAYAISRAHDKVLDNQPYRIGIWKCWFLRRRENRSTRRKTSRSKDENQQQTQPTRRRVRESNPGHIGGRRALTTTPSMLLSTPTTTTSLSPTPRDMTLILTQHLPAAPHLCQ